MASRVRVLPVACATAPRPALAGRVGEVLRGKWRLEALLASGTLGCVYAARHRNGRRGAIKIMHPRLARDRGLRERFALEAQLANCVSHPDVVQLLDDDVAQDGSPFLVMELYRGRSVAALAAEHGGKLSEPAVLSLLDQLLDIVAVMHDCGVIHRDIEPSNVLVTDTGSVKLLDFGSAMRRSAGRIDDAVQTRVIGAPGFRPPEHAGHPDYRTDVRSDLWSVGALAFTLLSGRRVHAAATEDEAIRAAVSKRAPPLSSVAPEVRGALASVVDRALAFEPDSRWPDARAMRRAQARHAVAMQAPLAP